jgi:hypothetical protein
VTVLGGRWNTYPVGPQYVIGRWRTLRDSATPTAPCTSSWSCACAATSPRDYIARRLAEGKNKNEIMRCVKRYIAREIYHALREPARRTNELIA